MNKHEAAKARICRWCSSKVGNIRIFSNSLNNTKLGELHSQYFDAIDPSDDNRPQVVCNTCKIYLLKRASGKSSLNIPVRFDWPITINTRLQTCNQQNRCHMCIESSRFGYRCQAQVGVIHKKRGRPSIASPQKVIKLCNKCLSRIHPGISHICLKTTLKDNAYNMLEHHQALDTFVGDELIRKANCSQDLEKHLQLPLLEVTLSM